MYHSWARMYFSAFIYPQQLSALFIYHLTAYVFLRNLYGMQNGFVRKYERFDQIDFVTCNYVSSVFVVVSRAAFYISFFAVSQMYCIFPAALLPNKNVWKTFINVMKNHIMVSYQNCSLCKFWLHIHFCRRPGFVIILWRTLSEVLRNFIFEVCDDGHTVVVCLQ